MLKKVQNLPEVTRKIILWAIMVIMGVGLFTFFVKNIQKRFESIEGKKIKEEFQLPKLEEELKKMPEIEIPKIIIP